LSKSYPKGIHALSDVSFNVPKGHIFGLLGPNGAGKTTLIKSLLGIISVSSGSAQILGQPFNTTKIKEQIGYLPENHKYPLFLTGYDVLYYFGGLSGIKPDAIKAEIPSLLKLVSMERWQNTKIKKYSKGMMQRIGLAQALIGDPDLIFLDEPTDGIDPVGRREIHEILRKLKAKGKTIFLNSHMLAEVESVCDTIAILKQGKLVKFGTVSDITTSKDKYILKIEYPEAQVMKSLESSDFILFFESENTYSTQVANVNRLNLLIDHLRKNDIPISAIYPEKATLEDSFIRVVSEDM
jgi:ABC-2 type transport system ATP-binding protein